MSIGSVMIRQLHCWVNGGPRGMKKPTIALHYIVVILNTSQRCTVYTMNVIEKKTKLKYILSVKVKSMPSNDPT